MAELNTRIEEFISALRPSKGQRNAVKTELDFLEGKLSDFISDDDTYKFVKALRSGSYAKTTILKRHEQGDFDADIGIYLESEDGSAIKITDALMYVESLLNKAYKDRTSRKPKYDLSKKSSIKVVFEDRPKINLDVVCIETKDHDSIDNWGQILRSDGTKRDTSITEHVRFVSERNKLQADTPFNQLIMLFKWWRNHKFDESEQEKFSSFFIETFVGKAFDATYKDFNSNWTDNLRKLCLWMIHHRLQERVEFNDNRIDTPSSYPNDPVVVLDPLNKSNNITHDWTDADRTKFIEGIEEFNAILRDVTLSDDDDDLDDDLELLDGILPNFSDWSE